MPFSAIGAGVTINGAEDEGTPVCDPATQVGLRTSGASAASAPSLASHPPRLCQWLGRPRTKIDRDDGPRSTGTTDQDRPLIFPVRAPLIYTPPLSGRR